MLHSTSTYGRKSPLGDATVSHRGFLYFVLAYVFLLSLASVSNSGLFKLLSYIAAFAMFLVLFLNASATERKPGYASYYAPVLFIYYYGLIASSAFNHETLNIPVLFKLMLAPAFLLFGAKLESIADHQSPPNRTTKWALVLLIALPLVALAVQLAHGVNVYARGVDFSIFANRNNAGLYAVALLSLYAVYMREPVKRPVVYLIAGASFATLGVLIAVMLSLVFLVTNRRNFIRSIIGISLAVAVSVVLAQHEIGVFERFKPVIGTLDLLFFSNVDFRSVSYGQLVRLLDTTDLSLAFRIKHWLDIYDIYTQGPYFHWFFGYGIGASEIKTLDHIVPHNDYLRYLFEGGAITFLGFLGMISSIIIRLGRRWEAVPLLAITLYMVSENLVDNFVAMAIFYYSAGVLTYRIVNKHAQASSTRNV